MKLPTIPSRIVWPMVIASRPGTSALATNPAISPMTSR